MNEYKGRKFRVVKGGPWHVVPVPFDVDWEDPRKPRLRALREKYRLDDVIRAGQNETQKFILLKEWVKKKMITHGFSCLNTVQAFDDPLDILEGVEQGLRFFCSHHALVYAKCCEALGYPCRQLSLSMIGCEFPGKAASIGHVVAEVWNNEFQKWMVIDADTNLHYEKEGVPLSASQVCMLFHANQGQKVRPIYGAYTPLPDNSTQSMKGLASIDYHLTPDEVIKQWNQFLKHHVMDYYGMVSFSSFSGSQKRLRTLCYAPCGVHPPLIRNNLPTRAYDLWTDDDRTFDAPINRTIIKPECEDRTVASCWITMNLSHVMPFFHYFEARTDQQNIWHPISNPYRSQLFPGINRFTVRAVNQSGIKGPAVELHILYEEPKG